MNTHDHVIRGAIAALLALGVGAVSQSAIAANQASEKCAGAVKAGKNDCGTSQTGCHGSIKVDNHPEAWIEVPKGTCEKIAGAHVTTSPFARPGGRDAKS